MDPLVLLAPVALALVFVLAGLAKLKDLRAARQGLIEFGVPARIARPSAVLLPLIELEMASTVADDFDRMGRRGRGGRALRRSWR